ncbi:MAG: lamin tail domain-containing protein [Flaviramulus sp.]|nr:lamin tail domain-containing protein [Flaviramulus sp.]
MKKLYILFFILLSYSMSAQLVLNEALFDPASDITGDANGDGVRDAAADEFIEFVNNSVSPLDISGYKIYDITNYTLLPGTDTPRHTVPASTVIPANGVYVLFGGGTPTGSFGGAIVQTSSTGDLNLTNGGDVITVTDAFGNLILSFDSTVLGLNMGADQSAMRNPNITGDFELHLAVNGELFSPGVLAIPSTPSTPLVVNEVLFDPASDLTGDANGDGVRNSAADEFIEFVNNSSSSLDISGYTIFDATGFGTSTPRHTVPASTVIPANGVYVLFGGGTPTGSFGGAIVQTSSTGDLNLTNGGDVITIKNNLDEVILVFDSSSTGLNFGMDQSITRSPDITGDFVLHTSANASLLFSPGLKNSGAALNISSFLKSELSIYPNPVNNGIVTIKSQISGEKSIKLYDITGRQVLNTKLKSDMLDVSFVQSGLYLLNISINNHSSSSKLLIK